MNTKLDTKVDNVAWKEPWLHVMFHHHLSDIPCENMRGILFFFWGGQSSKGIQATLWPGSQWWLGCSSEDGAWHGKLPSLGCRCTSPQGLHARGEQRHCEVVNWRCGLLVGVTYAPNCVYDCFIILWHIHTYSYYVCFFPYSLRMFLQDSRFGFERYSLQTSDYASCQVDEILATVRHDITAVETNLEETWWSCSTVISISTNICFVGFWCWCVRSLWDDFLGSDNDS